MSWAHHNAGPQPIDQTYQVDLYVNDVVASRWTSQGADTRNFSLITDWTELSSNVRIEPGTYKLTLVIDALNQVPETDETDNRYELTLVVGGEPTPPNTAKRKPDLAFARLSGASPELVAATSYIGYPSSGPLSVDVPTHIQYRIANLGLTSVLRDIPVHIYLDDVLVRQTRWQALLAGQETSADPWSELLDTLRVTPGEHRLRIELDPGNLIDEADETNNTYIATFTWDMGAVPPAPASPTAPPPTPPAPPNQPNLTPGWRFGTDGPVIVSTRRDTTKDDAIIVGQRTFVDVTVFNESAVNAGPFAVELLVDGVQMRRFDFRNGVPGGHSTWQSDWDRLLEAASPSAGPHTLKLVIDPDNAVAETNEDDNIFERTVTWYSSAAAVPTPQPKTVYSDAQAREILAPLASLLDDTRNVLGAPGLDRTADILSIADVGYFLMTGESFKDQLLGVQLLTHADYLDQIDSRFVSEFASAPVQEYGAVLQRRERLKTKSLGYKTRLQGSVVVYVDAERPFSDVLGSLMHELGHARQDFLNPALEDGQDTLARKGIKEAAAQQFERAFWLRLQAFTGRDLMRYPNSDAYSTVVDGHVDGWLEEYPSEEHSLGYLLQWTVPLADTSLGDLRTELNLRGLGAGSALQLYDHFANLQPSQVETYVSQLTALFNEAHPTIRSLAKRRLEFGLPVDAEGSAHLRIPGLLMP